MEWSDSDPRSLGEIFRSFLARAFARLSGLSEPAPKSLEELISMFDPLDTPAEVRLGLEAETGQSFAEVSRHILMASLLAAGQTLNPRRSGRYLRGEGLFRCNIYATDFVELLPHGAWLPKVGFSYPLRVARDLASAATAPLHRVSATGANRFIAGKLRGSGGERFGWVKLEGSDGQVKTRAQELANEGALVVFSAGTKKRTAHVGVVVPEEASFGGKRVMDFWGNAKRTTGGTVVSVWRSQSGVITAHGTTGGTDVLANADERLDPGFYVYEPAKDESRGNEVERVSLR